jgi:hypothetical protein
LIRALGTWRRRRRLVIIMQRGSLKRPYGQRKQCAACQNGRLHLASLQGALRSLDDRMKRSKQSRACESSIRTYGLPISPAFFLFGGPTTPHDGQKVFDERGCRNNYRDSLSLMAYGMSVRDTSRTRRDVRTCVRTTWQRTSTGRRCVTKPWAALISAGPLGARIGNQYCGPRVVN